MSLQMLALFIGVAGSLRMQAPWTVGSRSMRGRLGRASVRAAEGEDSSSSSSSSGSGGNSSEGGVGSFIGGLFKTNRDTPEAQANQIEWARQQMNMEVPDSTLDGLKLEGRDDMVAKYIVSEKEKFGRDVDQATAEQEVDSWLLTQATYAPAQTTTGDLVAAAAVFLLAFGSGLYFADKTPT